jgi:hypothetical protein
VKSAEADAVPPEARARLLVEAAHLFQHLAPFEDAKALGQTKCDAARHSRERLIAGEIDKRFQQRGHMRGEPVRQPRLDEIARRARQLFVGKDHEARLQRVVARDQAADGIALPAEIAVERQYDLAVAGARESFGALDDRSCKRLLSRVAERLRFRAFRLRIRRKAEA